MSIITKTIASQDEKDNRERFMNLFKSTSIPPSELLANIGLFLKRQEFSKILFFQEIYQQILNTHGVIMEFGTRWGQNLVTLNNLRGIYEPYNYNRRIIGFDTFEGFKNTNAEKDGSHEVIKEGAFGVSKGYEAELEQILRYHETEAPLSHVKKNYILKGDAVEQLEKYLKDNPQTIIAFAYFDFDIYEPTKNCLELIKPCLTKGSIIGFDELNDPHFPGETLALKEVFGLDRYSVKRSKFSSIQSYLVVE